MRLISIKPEISEYKTFKEFEDAFKLTEKDFIFTTKFVAEVFLKPYKCFLFEDYGLGEPTDEMIDAILKDARKKDYKRIVAIGGGSVLDIAKLIALRPTGFSLDYFEKKVPIEKDKELILIPTTCGTGSCVTNISIAEIISKHTKLGLAVDELYADKAVLIPELVRGLPYPFFIASSIDALIHAMESFLSPRSNRYAELFSIGAIELILESYKKLLIKGKEYRTEIIEDFLIGSNYAGIAFGNTGVGAVHALSYLLGGNYHVPHGEANYQFLIEVFKTYNRKNPKGKIVQLNKILARILEIKYTENVYEKLAETLDKLLARKPLKEYGMKPEEIESFADSVIKGQQRLLANNYVELSRDEIRDIYKALY